MQRFLVRDGFLSMVEFPTEERALLYVQRNPCTGWTLMTEDEAKALNPLVGIGARIPNYMVFDCCFAGSVGSYFPVYSEIYSEDSKTLHWSQTPKSQECLRKKYGSTAS